MGLQDLTGWELQIVLGIRRGLQDLTGSKHQIERACYVSGRVLHDLTSLEHKIVHAYNISGRNCRISRVGNYRSYMPTRHQEGTSGSHGFETPDRTCLLGVTTALHDLTSSNHKACGGGCKISRVRNTRSYMLRRYQEGAAGCHRLGTADRTCLRDITTGVQGLTGSGPQIEHS